MADSSPLKQFALPILCDFAHAGKATRRLLWRHDGLAFYLGLLRDPFWANPALEALLAWLVDEPARVEECLLEPDALAALLRAFCTTTRASFDNLLEPFYKILRASPAVAAKLASQPSFFQRIVGRLSRGGGKAVVRLNLLRLIKVAFDAVPDQAAVVRVSALPETVRALALSDPAVLVQRLAQELGREFGQVELVSAGGSRVVPRSSNVNGTTSPRLPMSPRMSGDKSVFGALGKKLGVRKALGRAVSMPVPMSAVGEVDAQAEAASGSGQPQRVLRRARPALGVRGPHGSV